MKCEMCGYVYPATISTQKIAVVLEHLRTKHKEFLMNLLAIDNDI